MEQAVRGSLARNGRRRGPDLGERLVAPAGVSRTHSFRRPISRSSRGRKQRMKILIIGGNVEALAANYILAERGHDPTIVIEPSFRVDRNSFTHGPWRPVGASPLLMDLLGDLDLDFSDYKSEIGALDSPEILSVEAAIESKIGVDDLHLFPELRAAVAGRPMRELSFDRQAFFSELAGVASVETEAVRADSVSFSGGRIVWARLGKWASPHAFDLAIVTAPPRVWDPGCEARDRIMTEVVNAPTNLLPFDLVEGGGRGGLETITWRDGTAIVESSGRGLPNLPLLLGVEPAEDRAHPTLMTGNPGYRIGSSVRIRHEIGDVNILPHGALAIGRSATGKSQTLSGVLEAIADLVG